MSFIYILIIFLSKQNASTSCSVLGFLSESSDELGQDEQADDERSAGWPGHRDSGPPGYGELWAS